MIQGRELRFPAGIDAFDGPYLAVVVMVTNQLVGLHERLGLDGVVEDQYPIGDLNLAHKGLDDFPQVRRTIGLLVEAAGDAVVGDFSLHQSRQACGSGLTGIYQHTSR